MTAAVQSTQVTVRCRGSWETGARTRLQVRRFDPFYTDEPKAAGGTDMGPNPLEYVIAAFNGCVSVMVKMCAAELGFRYEGIEYAADGTIDVRGLMGDCSVKPHFQEVRQTVRLKTDESPERIAQLKEMVESRCPVANLFRDAGVPVHSVWEAL